MIESSFKFCPLCATKLESRLIDSKERPICPSCGWIYFPDPKVAVVVVILKEKSVLLTRRIFEPYKGCWSLPGGFVDAYEDPVNAAERECLEETSLQVKVTGLVDLFSGREHPRGADIILVYQGFIDGGILRSGDDADAAEFFPLNELPSLAFKTTQKVLERFKNQLFETN
jgi:8-oxo-dGTP diphosphatase